MSEMKRCAQCGLLKDATDFRLYTYSKKKDTQGRYRICKGCENINSKYRAAVKLIAENPSCSTNSPLYERWQHALAFIPKCEELYRRLIAKGLHPVWNQMAKAPKTYDESDVDSLLSFYADGAPVVQPKVSISVDATEALPDDLRQWLTCDPQTWRDNDLDPEYLQETIYESLKAKYRPQIGWDKQKSIPIYDDTYKDVLNQILRRFDDYEDELNLEAEDSDE